MNASVPAAGDWSEREESFKQSLRRVLWKKNKSEHSHSVIGINLLFYFKTRILM